MSSHKTRFAREAKGSSLSFLFPGGFLIILWISLTVPACSPETKQETKPQGAFPVTVGSVTQKSVPLQVWAIGNVEAYSAGSVKSQVGGLLAEVYFREGQDAKRDDPLFTIDPRPFEASLRQAVVGGLLFSQIITLYITPVVYVYLDRLQQKINKNLRLFRSPAGGSRR